jgi:hypothetical protein
VALPTELLMLTITDTALDGSATCNLQLSDVCVLQAVKMQPVFPICALIDGSDVPPKLMPSIVTLASPDKAAFGA